MTSGKPPTDKVARRAWLPSGHRSHALVPGAPQVPGVGAAPVPRVPVAVQVAGVAGFCVEGVRGLGNGCGDCACSARGEPAHTLRAAQHPGTPAPPAPVHPSTLLSPPAYYRTHSMASQYLDYCTGQRDWLLDFIEALVAIESPSDDPAAVNRCGAELASRELEERSLSGTVTFAHPPPEQRRRPPASGLRPGLAPDPAARSLRHRLADRSARRACR